jgi:hypothetical protein
MSVQTADGPDEQPDKAEVPLAFRIDALHHRIKTVSDLVHESVTKVSQIAQSMADTAMRAIGRGPDPDATYPPENDMDRITRLAMREAARAAVEIGTYNEGGGNNKPEPSWQKWVLTIVGTSIAIGIGATAYQLSELKEKVATVAAKQDTSLAATNQRLEANERRIENLERRVFQ